MGIRICMSIPYRYAWTLTRTQVEVAKQHTRTSTHAQAHMHHVHMHARAALLWPGRTKDALTHCSRQDLPVVYLHAVYLLAIYRCDAIRM